MEDLDDLFLDCLQDIYYAEKQGTRGLTKVIKFVTDSALKDALNEHRALGAKQMERLDEVFSLVGKKPRGKKCAAMDGLLSETNEQIAEAAKGPILDCALLATAQAMEHYEIARYGALHAWASAMNLDEAAELLAETLTEERESDELLSTIAAKLNRVAAGTDEEEDEEEFEEDDEEEEDEEEEEAEEPEPEEVMAEQEPPPPPPKPARGRAKKR